MTHLGGLHRGVTVRSGPRWLVHLLFYPPGWFRVLYYLTGILLLGWAAYGLYRRGWRIDRETEHRMLGIALTILSVITMTLLAKHLLAASYMASVAAGWLGGFLTAGLIDYLASSRLVTGRLGLSSSERRVLAWLGLGGVSVLVTQALSGSTPIPMVTRSGWLLLAVGILMAAHDVIEAEDATRSASD